MASYHWSHLSDGRVGECCANDTTSSPVFLLAGGKDHVRFLRIDVHRVVRYAFIEVLPCLVDLFRYVR